MSEIHTISSVDKEIVDKLIEKSKIFATRDDVENGNTQKNPIPDATKN